jgi:trehalose/maltose hydrolase-like predicted phosphorylase
VLDEQIARRRHRRVPTLDDDPAWTIREDDTSAVRRRVADALLCLSSGGVTTRGSLEEDTGAGPRVLASGHYRGSGPDEELLPLPWWTSLDVAPSPACSTRVLDLRTGVLLREERGATLGADSPLRSMRLASAARPGVVALRAEAARGRLRPGTSLHPAPGEPVQAGAVGDRRWVRTDQDDAHRADAVAAARQRAGRPPGLSVVDRVACYVRTPAHPSLGEALARLDAASDAGFDGLLREQREIAADILLGRDRVAGTQLIKQPDVLMLHHLVPQEAGPDSLGPDVAFYAPRTTHGSSLSPGITAAVLARAGRTDEALRMLRLTLALDPEDVAGTTGSGLHVAALGAAWQAVLTGFAGVRVKGGTLVVDPHPPAAWPCFEIRFRCLGRRLRLEIDHHGTTVRTDLPLRVRLYDRPPVWVHDVAHGAPTSGRHACPTS